MDIATITTKIEKAIEELVELKITTKVGDKQLQTTIDLVQGDITMSIDPWFNEPEQKPLLDMHLLREKQGAEIVKQNVEALSRLIKLLPELKKVV